MKKFTTPTNIFEVNKDLTDAVLVYLSYAQNGEVVIEKAKEDLTIEPETITVQLTQEETGKLDAKYNVQMEITAKWPDGSRYTSNRMTAPVDRVIKSEVI